MLGYKREELVGKTVFDIIPAEDAARLSRVKADLVVPGNVDRAEWVLIRKDRTLIPVEVSSNILTGGRWQAFVRDITKRKQLEDERRVFVSLLDNSSDFIGIADPSGKPTLPESGWNSQEDGRVACGPSRRADPDSRVLPAR